jgi:hypothetical protein
MMRQASNRVRVDIAARSLTATSLSSLRPSIGVAPIAGVADPRGQFDHVNEAILELMSPAAKEQ